MGLAIYTWWSGTIFLSVTLLCLRLMCGGAQLKVIKGSYTDDYCTMADRLSLQSNHRCEDVIGRMHTIDRQ